MRVVLGGDHRGYQLKDLLIAHLTQAGHTAIDVGTNSPESVDYPDISQAVCEAVLDGQADRGVIVCGSGVGACVAANKIAGIRAAITHDTYSAHQGVEHDDMNVLCLGSEVIGAELAIELVRAFLAARFDGAERYVRRLEKIEEMEREKTYG